MLTTLKTTAVTLLRTPSVLIWMLAFPVLMSTVFLFMFASMRNDGTVDPVPVAVVADAAWEASPFSETVEALGSEGAEGLLDPVFVGDKDEADSLLRSGDVAGVYAAGDDGEPVLTVAPASAGSSLVVDQSILEAVASAYVRSGELVATLAEADPAALADPARVASALGLSAGVERVSLTWSVPDETVRYLYALLGMAALMASQAGIIGVCALQPGLSALGARRSASGTSRSRLLAGAVLGAWLVSFACLAVAFGYQRLVVGVDFAGREGLCLLGVAAASLLATATGALVGSLPGRADKDARTGVLTALTCLLSLFAGLYGTFAMDLADWLARELPWTAWANPARLVCDLFYALYYYDSLVPFALRALACVGISLALLAAAALAFGGRGHGHP